VTGAGGGVLSPNAPVGVRGTKSKSTFVVSYDSLLNALIFEYNVRVKRYIVPVIYAC